MGFTQIQDYSNRQPKQPPFRAANRPEKGLTGDELAALLGSLRMERVASGKALLLEVQRFLSEQFGSSEGMVTGRTLWSYVRRYLTNYDEIRAGVKARVGLSELYDNIKVYLCCRIIREYELEVDPLYAAFGDAGGYGVIPKRFIVDNLEATVTQMILDEFVKGAAGSGSRIRLPAAGSAAGGTGRGGNGRGVDRIREIQDQDNQQEVSG